MKTDRRGNVKFIVANSKDRFTSYTTITYRNMFSDLNMCLFAGKDTAQKLWLF